MKKLFILLSLACMGLAVSSCYDDSELWESVNGLESRVKTLETLCSEMNTNISSLQDLAVAVQKGGYITEVTPLTENGVEVGYKVTLNDGRMVTIYHGKNGSAGNAPQIGVKQDSDGKYYWVVGGEWIKDDKGNKVPVSSGTTPKIKVENGKWYVSYDGGTTWEELGAATASDTCLFDDVTYTNGVLTLKFADGNVLSFPIGDTFRIVLGDFDPNWGDEVEIPYTIKGATGEVSIIALSDVTDQNDMDIYVKDIIEETPYSGKVIVNLGWWDDEEYNGRIVILASDENGTTVSKILKFVSGVMYPTDAEEYVLNADETQVAVKLTTNRTYEVNTNADWITYVDTKTLEEKTLLFSVNANEGAYRWANIEIMSGTKKLYLKVNQRATKKTDIFYVNIAYNEATGGNIPIGLDRLTNSSGKTVMEVLGYETWDDLAEAIGFDENINDFTGDVIVTAYDLHTGESFGKIDYYYDYWTTPNYQFDRDGYPSDYDYVVQMELSSIGYLYVNPYSYNNRDYALSPGESCTFGVLLSSEDAEARMEVTFDMIKYDDPEEGLYENPRKPGRYEFYLSDEFEITLADQEVYAKSSVHNKDIMEQVKSIMGMTTFDIYKHIDDIDMYFMAEDNEKYYTSSSQFDINGDMVRYYNSSRDYVANVGFNFSLKPENTYIYLSIPYESGYWTPMVMEAAENNTELNLKYGLEYNGYELIFYHTIKFIEGEEFVDPEAGLYDDPKEPGTYEFDLYDEIEFIWTPWYSFTSEEDYYELVKETLGMTAYELYRNQDKFEAYFLVPDGSKVDVKNGYYLDYCGLHLYWNMFLPKAVDNHFYLFSWSSSLPEGDLETEKEVSCQYVVESDEYKLLFNHTLKFIRAESTE